MILSFLQHRYQCPACHKTGVVVKQVDVQEVRCPSCETLCIPVPYYSHDLMDLDALPAKA